MICSKFLIHWIDQNSKKFIHLFLYLVLEILSYFLLTHSWRFQWMEFVPTMLISNHKTEAFNSITTFNIFFPPTTNTTFFSSFVFIIITLKAKCHYLQHFSFQLLCSSNSRMQKATWVVVYVNNFSEMKTDELAFLFLFFLTPSPTTFSLAP